MEYYYKTIVKPINSFNVRPPFAIGAVYHNILTNNVYTVWIHAISRGYLLYLDDHRVKAKQLDALERKNSETFFGITIILSRRHTR